MKYLITTDSSCDLSIEKCRKENIVPLFMNYEIDGENFTDTLTEKDILEFYEKERQGALPRTSQISPLTYVEFWKSILTKDCKEIVHITLSSGLSGSYSNAKMAVPLLLEQVPDAKIYVVDSLMASTGEGALVLEAVRLRNEAKTAEECAKWLEENKIKMTTFFTTDNLNYLHKGGRVSKTGAVFGTALKINPILRVDSNGKLTVYCKVRGEQNALDRIVEETAKTVVEPKKQVLYISHADNIEKAKKLGGMMQEKFGFMDVVYNYIGTTIGAHTGVGLIAAFFFGKSRIDFENENKSE